MVGSSPENGDEQTGPDATQLLMRVSEGDRNAAEVLMPLVYQELRARAGAYFRGQPANHTLQPTALVHDAYLRLVRGHGENWRNRAHFCAVAATAMRQILINHAERRAVAKRARKEIEEEATHIESPSQNMVVNLLSLNEALRKLEELEPRQARLVELRFFAGMTIADVACVLEVSTSTIEKEWRRVRAWLLGELTDQSDP